MVFKKWYDSTWIGRCDEREAESIWNAATKAEREACAKVCDEQAEKDRAHQDAGNQPADYRIGYMDGSGDCGHAIRARSNASNERTPLCGGPLD